MQNSQSLLNLFGRQNSTRIWTTNKLRYKRFFTHNFSAKKAKNDANSQRGSQSVKPNTPPAQPNDANNNRWLGQTWKKNPWTMNDSDFDFNGKNTNSFFNQRNFKLLIGIGFFSFLVDGIQSSRRLRNLHYISMTSLEEDYLAKNRIDHFVIYDPKSVEVHLKKDDGQITTNPDTDPAINKQLCVRTYFMPEFISEIKRLSHKYELKEDLQFKTFFATHSIFVVALRALASIFGFFAPIIFFTFMFYKFLPQNMPAIQSMFSKNFGPSISQQTRTKKPSVTFNDVAGCEEAKFEIKEFVDFLKNPAKYTALGAKIPNGVLLSGPPGSGKTLLARATAGESNVPFYHMKGSEFMQMFVGMGSMKIRNLFDKARANAPSIVFIDEIDAVGRQRSKSEFGAAREYDNTLNQLLTEMDGFNRLSMETRDPVIVIGATNLPDVLDPALKRSGRFDRHIVIPLPDKKGRQQIFDVHLKNLKAEDQEKHSFSKHMSELTPGMSGADIQNICNEGALIAARENSDSVGLIHLEKATDRIVGGLERKSFRLDPKELEIVAYHEAGHAIVGHALDMIDPVLKISIIPRGKGLGYTQYKLADRHLMSREKLYQTLCNLLGGRAAETVKFSDFTTGAMDDLMKVTEIAYAYVTTYGMSDSLSPMNYNAKPFERPLSDVTIAKIDSEVNMLVKKAMDKAVSILSSKIKILDKVAKQLIEKEVLNYDEFLNLMKG